MHTYSLSGIGRRFHQYLRFKGLRNNEAAELMKISPSSIGNLINGKNYSASMLLALPSSFPKLNLEWLLVGHGPMEDQVTSITQRAALDLIYKEIQQLKELPAPKTDAIAKERTRAMYDLMEQLVDIYALLVGNIAEVQQTYLESFPATTKNS